jgi:hypothetical protein
MTEADPASESTCVLNIPNTMYNVKINIYIINRPPSQTVTGSEGISNCKASWGGTWIDSKSVERILSIGFNCTLIVPGQ